jgi:hypothetical protein
VTVALFIPVFKQDDARVIQDSPKNAALFPDSCNSFRAACRNLSRTHADNANPDRSAASLNACFSRMSSRTSKYCSRVLGFRGRPRLLPFLFVMPLIVRTTNECVKRLDAYRKCPHNKWEAKKSPSLLITGSGTRHTQAGYGRMPLEGEHNGAFGLAGHRRREHECFPDDTPHFHMNLLARGLGSGARADENDHDDHRKLFTHDQAL